MADVGTEWQGLSRDYEVTMEEHYEFSWKEFTGVPPMGEASLVLPPYTASTGLQPSEPNPYLGKGDASMTYGNAERQACKKDDVCSEDEFSPAVDQLYSPWPLGEKDMMSLFTDLHGEDYVAALDVAMCNMKAEQEQPFMSEWQVQEAVRCEESNFEEWASYQFAQVRDEEDWGSQELAAPSYVLIADDWYPDKDWSAKWNRQFDEAGVPLTASI